MGSNGIDLSNQNGRVDLSHGFSGLDFVIAKCTEGTTFVDTSFFNYESQAKTLGVEFGAYHFLHAENLDGESEALFFLSHFKPESGIGIWIDYETYGLEAAVDVEVVSLFAETIKARFPRQKVGLYANLTGMRKVVPLGVDMATDAFWLAYPNGQVETPDAPMPNGRSWSVHQYETFAGIDRDFSRWGSGQMRQFFTW